MATIALTAFCAAVLALLLAGLVRARRTQARIEARIETAEAALQAESRLARERADRMGEEVASRIGGLEGQIQAFQQSAQEDGLQLRGEVATLRGTVEQLVSGFEQRVREEVQGVNQALGALDQRPQAAALQRITETSLGLVEASLPRNSAPSDGDQETGQQPLLPQLLQEMRAFRDVVRSEGSLLVLEGSTEEQILGIARSLAYVRPLVAYPNWSFDIDFARPDITYRMRQQIWNYFRDRNAEVALTIGWHSPLKLCLCLSNDLSRQTFIAGCIDPNEFAFLDKVLEPGMSFLDAGAHEGIYTLFAAVRVGHGAVWAFEPSQREMERLEQNIRLNCLGNVKTFRMGLADEDGEAELTIASAEHSGQNTLGEFVYPTVEALRREVVPVRTLDRVVEDEGITRLDILKLDVEGAEHRLLRGARNTLRAFRPVILLEASDAALRKQDGDRKGLCAELAAQDYRIYSFDPSSGLPTARIVSPYSDNLVAAPVEKALPESVFEMAPRLSR